jgi:hypothetical protein
METGMRSSIPRIVLFLFILILPALACRSASNESSSGGQEEPFSSQTFSVPARAGWTNTGIRVQPGTRLVIQSLSGEWSPWPGGAYDAIGFGGDPRCDCNVMAGVSHAALIGRIGESQPFLVGEMLDLRTGESGDLYLGINDVDLADNSGSLQVEVRFRKK